MSLPEREFWDYGAKIYPPQSAVEEYLGQLAPLYSPHRTVADLGCGRGEFMSILGKLGHDAIGVDLSEESRRAVTGRGFAFHRMDVLEFLASPPVRYDGLFTYGLLEHLDASTVSRLFAVMGERVEAGTEAVFATHNPESIQALTRPLYAELSHERLYSPELISFLFETHGFEVRRVGPLVQQSTLVSDKALTVEENGRFLETLQAMKHRGQALPAGREIEYLAGRVDVIERVLDQVVKFVNVPMDYFVFAVKK